MSLLQQPGTLAASSMPLGGRALSQLAKGKIAIPSEVSRKLVELSGLFGAPKVTLPIMLSSEQAGYSLISPTSTANGFGMGMIVQPAGHPIGILDITALTIPKGRVLGFCLDGITQLAEFRTKFEIPNFTCYRSHVPPEEVGSSTQLWFVLVKQTKFTPMDIYFALAAERTVTGYGRIRVHEALRSNHRFYNPELQKALLIRSNAS